MTIYRVIKDRDNPYVQINRNSLHNQALSWKARGILSYILTLPDNWTINRKHLAGCSPDGVSSLDSGLKELEASGHLVRYQEKNPDGTFGKYITEVYETPQCENRTSVIYGDYNEKSEENSQSQPQCDFLNSDNRTLINNIYKERNINNYKKEKKYYVQKKEKSDDVLIVSDDPVQSKSDINAIEDQSCVNKTEKLSTYQIVAKSSSNQVTDSKAKKRFNIISIPRQSTKQSQFKEGTELTDEWRTIALNEGVHESWIESIYREFVEYWTGATGKKAYKKDWKATWRNWVSREAIRKKYPKPASQIAEQDVTITREFKELEEETQEAIIRRKLREKVGDASYHSWIQGLGFEIQGDTIKVYAKTAFIRDWVQREYSTLIKECSNFTKVSLLIGQIEKPEEQKHSDQQRKIALIEARIDSIEHDPTLRKIRKYLLNRMGDGYERLLGHVKLYYETGYLKAYVTNVAHRSFLLNYHDTILKALDGKVKKFEVSIVERVSV